MQATNTGPESNLTIALNAIDSAKVSFPDDELLRCFVKDAIDPNAAARYLLQRGTRNTSSADFNAFLKDWKELISTVTSSKAAPYTAITKTAEAAVRNRDGNTCCLTGLETSLFDPLIVAPLFSLREPIPDSLQDVLEAFVGHDMNHLIVSLDASLQGPGNHWLVRKSAAEAMSEGWIMAKPVQGQAKKVAKYTVTVPAYSSPVRPRILDQISVVKRRTFAGRAGPDVELPSSDILRLASQFSASIRWSSFGRDIDEKRSKRQTSATLPEKTRIGLASSLWNRIGYIATSFLFAVWRRIVPATLRIYLYRFLGLVGTLWYSPTCSVKVQQLPFGMYLKSTTTERQALLENERAALQLAHFHASVSVPRPLDLVSDGHESYLLMTRAPGILLGACIDTLDDDELDLLKSDLQQFVTELRKIRRCDVTGTGADGQSVSGVLGGPLYDHRVNMGWTGTERDGDFKGPFADEDAFINALQMQGALPGLTHSGGHQIVFTHGDLNLRNVLVHNGRLSGVVDWENAGWYPEYWDYTKAHFVTKLKRRWLRLVDDAFLRLGDYQSELAIERQYWCYCN